MSATTRRLAVLLNDDLAGHVERLRDQSLQFRYAETYRGVVPLSPALPVGDRLFHDHEISAYMEGLLPDNADVRQRWARDLGTDDSPFGLLSHMGLDCAGAARFVPENAVADAIARDVADYLPQPEEWIGRRLSEVGRSDQTASWTLPDEHWSLAGAQGKITLAWIDGVWCEARSGSPTTHILKPGIATMKNQAATEYATMRVAQRLGLRTARVELLTFDGQQAIVVERYDRLRSADGPPRRLHQVDLCQAEGKRPNQKYEVSGGSSARTLGRLLRRLSTRPDTDVLRFSDALVFNYLTGSPDGHAKNFSLLYAGRQLRLAPLYDLATGLPYDNQAKSPTSAFSIGGVRNFGEAYLEHWVQHAKDLGLDPDERVARVRELLDAIPDTFREVLHGEELGEEGPILWARMTQRPGRLLGHVKQQRERLGPDPAESALGATTTAVSELVAVTRTALSRGERPLAATDHLAAEVDRLRGLIASFNLAAPDEAAGARRTDLLVASRDAAALVLLLASEEAASAPPSWTRRIAQLGDIGTLRTGSTVLIAQTRLPALALLAAAGLAATVAERWELVDLLLTGLVVDDEDGTERPLALTSQLVEACSGEVWVPLGQPGFAHPMGLLAAYAGNVARAAGLLSASDVADGWDKWEYLWLAARTGAGQMSGVPHLVVARGAVGPPAPAVRGWASRRHPERDRALPWLDGELRETLDELLVAGAEASAHQTSQRGRRLGGQWRLDERGRHQLPVAELRSWRAFLSGSATG